MPIAFIEAGSRFGGANGSRYLVEKEVGRGGQAVVYLARDTRLNRPLALKVCTALDANVRSQFNDRFERELKLSSRVSHPHVVEVYDAAELPDGRPFSMIEWMEYGSLVDLVEGARKAGRHIPVSYARYYGTAVASALRACHDADVVHRDIKPDNILIGPHGIAKVVDFGIALDLRPDAPRLTQVGGAVGTPGFMAPEQLMGASGPQSDIFSLGVTLYLLLVGELPKQMMIGAFPSGSVLDEAWDKIDGPLADLLRRMTTPDLSQRPTSCDEIIRLFEQTPWPEFTGGLPSLTSLPPLPTAAYLSTQTNVDARAQTQQAPVEPLTPPPAAVEQEAPPRPVEQEAPAYEPEEEPEAPPYEPEEEPSRRPVVAWAVLAVGIAAVLGVSLWWFALRPAADPADADGPSQEIADAGTDASEAALTPLGEVTGEPTPPPATRTAPPPAATPRAAATPPPAATPAPVAGAEPVSSTPAATPAAVAEATPVAPVTESPANTGDVCAGVDVASLASAASLTSDQTTCLVATAKGQRPAPDPEVQAAAVALFNHKASGWSGAVEAALGRPALKNAPALNFAGLKPAYDRGRYPTVLARSRIVWRNMDKGTQWTRSDRVFVTEFACRSSAQLAMSGDPPGDGLDWCERWLDAAERAGTDTSAIQDLIDQVE